MHLVQQQTNEIMTLHSIPRGALNNQLLSLSPNSYQVRPIILYINGNYDMIVDILVVWTLGIQIQIIVFCVALYTCHILYK